MLTQLGNDKKRKNKDKKRQYDTDETGMHRLILADIMCKWIITRKNNL